MIVQGFDAIVRARVRAKIQKNQFFPAAAHTET
jgi:hypothetical protein